MKTVAELEARIKELEDAIEWALDKLNGEGIFITNYFIDELRSRAFPPQFEEVEVKLFTVFNSNGKPYHSQKTPFILEDYDKERGHYVVETSGPYKRPIPTKVKRREELEVSCCDVDTITLQRGNIAKPLHCRYFAEWESEP